MLWHYELQNQAQGPVTTEKLGSLVAQGVLTPKSLVWTEGMATWTPLLEAARQYTELNFGPSEAPPGGAVGDFPTDQAPWGAASATPAPEAGGDVFAAARGEDLASAHGEDLAPAHGEAFASTGGGEALGGDTSQGSGVVTAAMPNGLSLQTPIDPNTGLPLPGPEAPANMLATVATVGVQEVTTPTATCCQCGRIYSRDDMIAYGEQWVCATCKPGFFQRLKEGLNVGGALTYASFWARFAAKFIDGIALQAIYYAVLIPSTYLTRAGGATASVTGPLFYGVVVICFGYGFPAFYNAFFLGRFGATPGKMALGIRVVRSDQSPISYARGLARHFAEYISAIILFIGYIMAGFDQEHRALHDHICDTRVVKR